MNFFKKISPKFVTFLIIVYLSFTLIGCLSTPLTETTEVTEETEKVIEEIIKGVLKEDTEADTSTSAEDIYFWEMVVIKDNIVDGHKKFYQSVSDNVYGKISLLEHKAITQEYVVTIKVCYNMYLELEPSKKFEKIHDLFGEEMTHRLRCAMFLQSYIDSDDMEEMMGYFDLVKVELNLADEYALKINKEVEKLIEQ